MSGWPLTPPAETANSHHRASVAAPSMLTNGVYADVLPNFLLVLLQEVLQLHVLFLYTAQIDDVLDDILYYCYEA